VPKTHHCIAVSPVEHKAVLDTCYALDKKGLAEIISLRVDSKGRLDLEHLEQVCKSGVSLLCIMAANNEVGNIYPIQEVGQIAQKYDIPSYAMPPKPWGKSP
jgi:cysteine desulfurase